MELVLFWLLFSIIVGVAASSRGRSGFGWFLLSMIISPILSLILVLVLPRIAETGVLRSSSGEAISEKTHVRCPECKELIRIDAAKCRYCGTALVPGRIE